MQSVRILQRRTFEQFLRSRTYTTKSIQSHPPSRSTVRTTRPSSTRPIQTRSLHTYRRKIFSAFRSSAKTRPFASTATEQTQNLSLSQRLKKLSREYGWSALGVYLLLSAADFPFCFLAVRWLGTDRIGHWEHVVVTWVKKQIAVVWPAAAEEVDDLEGHGKRLLEEGAAKVEGMLQRKNESGTRILEEERKEGEEEYAVMYHGYKEAEAANKGDNASIWTQLALAYAIHKSFIFIRVPLTAAVTPKVVKTLRGWGWNIGKRPVSKTATGVSGTGVNTKGAGVKSD